MTIAWVKKHDYKIAFGKIVMKADGVGQMRMFVLLAIFAFGLLFLGCATQPQNPPASGNGGQNANANQQAQPPAVLTREEICNKIQSADYRNWCMGFVTGKSSYCDSIAAENDRNDCYGVTGMNAKDASVCNKITNGNKKQTCLAAATDDVRECDAAEESGKPRCINQYAAFKKDLSACEGVADRTSKESCYVGVAKATANGNACAYYTTTMKDRCYLEVVRTGDELRYCDNVADSGLKATCTAIANKDYSLCPANDNNCKIVVAMSKSDWSICGSMFGDDKTGLDACYIQIATFRLERNLI